MNDNNVPVHEKSSESKSIKKSIGAAYEIIETVAKVTVIIMLAFAFIGRLNIVDGSSMRETLVDGEELIVSDLFYTPKAGDIVVVHDISAFPYNEPLVKRVIATEGQTVDIDFSTWTLTVDGKVIDEPYRWLDPSRSTLTADYSFPITVPDGEIFVLGDNRNGSADSRQIEIGTIDTRCIVGRAIARILPFNKFTVFKSPYEK